MLKIGSLILESNVILGPMAGVTDLPFRLVCKDFGCGMVCSEMISSRALHYEDRKTYNLLETDENESPLSVQIFGSEPELMAQAAEKIESMNIASVIDINMGCPAPKIVNNNDGSALMKDIKLSEKIVKAVRNATKLPVTVKFRKGWEASSENYLDFGIMCEASGADAVTLHGRTRTQYYSGKADWEAIKKLKDKLSIPVIGNGDIFKFEDIQAMIDKTGVDGVMIARGSLGNPFIFSGITPDRKTLITTALKHLELMVNVKGEHIGMLEAKKHMAWYVKGMHGAARIKDLINSISEYDKMKNLMTSLLEEKYEY